MTDAEFDAVVGQIYRAATGELDWMSVLDRLEALLGASVDDTGRERSGTARGARGEHVRRLREHVAEATRMRERVRRMRVLAAASDAGLEGVAAPVWLTRADGSILFRNRAALAEHERGRGLELSGARLALGSLRDDAALTEALAATSRGEIGSRSVIALGMRGAEGPTWLHIVRVPCAESSTPVDEGPVLMAMLFEPVVARALDRPALTRLFDLTPTQARVACRLAEGHTLAQIAVAGGITVATVRSHLHGALRRLGVPRSQDLVRLLHDGNRLCMQARTDST